MTDIQAVIMGIVQGATEFLPISSTAHLRIAESLMGVSDENGAAFTAIIQWGTLLASLVYFRKDILHILFQRTKTDPDVPADKSDETGQHLLVPIIVGTIPVVVLGILLKHKIEHEFRSLTVIGISLIVFALLLAWADAWHTGRRHIGGVTTADGLRVGIAQAFALIPGASRSGTTITGALAIGMERAAAARFSFLLSLPAVFGAGLKELWDERHHITQQHMTRPIIIATVVSFVVGWVAIDWLLKYLKNHPTYVFVAYRILAGIALIALAASGTLK